MRSNRGPEDAPGGPGLPWTRKLGYSTAELGIVSVEVLVEIYLLKFYHVVVGLPAGLAGLALALAIVWDAVSDPIMGEISDQTTHRMGRRRPFILPGALALAGAFIAIYNPPGALGVTGKFLYLLGTYLSLTTAMTVIGVPHIALGGELSFDRHERTEIFGYRRLFTTAGLLLGTILPAWLLRGLGGEDAPGALARSRSLASLIMAAPILLSAWVTVRATRGLDPPAPSHQRRSLRPLALLRAQLAGLRNPVFAPLLLAFAIAGVGRAINASTALYYYDYRLGLSETETVMIVLLTFFLCLLASIPFWVAISRRLGKKIPAFAGVVGLGILVSIAYPLLPAGSLAGALWVAVLGGFLGGSIILFESLVPDVVDYDELKSGLHREGLYFGLWKMTVKLSRAVGLAISGLLLQAIGFESNLPARVPEAPPEVAERLGWIFGPGVGTFLILAGLIFLCFPLDGPRHRRIQALLRRRARRVESASPAGSA